MKTLNKLSALFIALMLSVTVFSGCNANNDGTDSNVTTTTPTHATTTAATETAIETPAEVIPIAVLEESPQIRVFENGNANIKLFPDGTFVANLFHNTVITGTYTEMTDGTEIAVLFSHNGVTTLAEGVGAFEADGLVTVVGGIADGVLTIPEDWDDGHGHGTEFTYREYPVVFIGDNNQKITLYADNTFAADFQNDVKIIGYYALRSTAVVFVPGNPAANRDGNIVGSFLLADLLTPEEDDHGHGHGHDEHDDDHDEHGDDHDEHDDDHDEHGDDHDEHGDDHDEHDDDHDEHDDHGDDHDEHDDVVTLELPEQWVEVTGVTVFTLQ